MSPELKEFLNTLLRITYGAIIVFLIATAINQVVVLGGFE